MSKTVAEMTIDELRALIDETIEEKLVGLLGDPDAGQELSEELRERLARQRQAVADGARGEDFDEIARRFQLP